MTRKSKSLQLQPELSLAVRKQLKTETRRSVTWPRNLQPLVPDWDAATVDPGFGDGAYLKVPCTHPEDPPGEGRVERVRCRYVVGDELYVQEPLIKLTRHLGDMAGDYAVYQADRDPVMVRNERLGDRQWVWSWQRSYLPARFCPKAASRTRLRVTAVEPQRLQDITWVAIRAEGLSCPEHDFAGGFCTSECLALREAFRELWNRLHGSGAWERNEWVWRIAFELLRKR